ncbi:prepilin-type N-terminal cleavage/methylation domain-containing protein [Halobacillus kuroshimensis]|uniref:ComG operon protein 3 n=1 Tax=Halobacillus kuroshimensis TaxID=302481 RepID=A0ABS3DZ31_9BACI|nr:MULTISPECIES: competence type IV pilus major pilin ComGC [Halobacillus]MBN8236615.1 prepilin-type N-terminal cleavage/methylation domain-containing protein [Halobacillus kuroshimensis]
MWKNEKGFTLIEMLIVLLVISVLLIITIPNLSQNTENIRTKGCDALKVTVEAQMEAYQVENNAVPTIEELKTAEYIKTTECPDGTALTITNGEVVEAAGE